MFRPMGPTAVCLSYMKLGGGCRAEVAMKSSRLLLNIIVKLTAMLCQIQKRDFTAGITPVKIVPSNVIIYYCE